MKVILESKRRGELTVDLPYEPQIGDEIRVGDYKFWVSSTHYRFDSEDGKYYRVLNCIVETDDWSDVLLIDAYHDHPKLVSNCIETNR